MVAFDTIPSRHDCCFTRPNSVPYTAAAHALLSRSRLFPVAVSQIAAPSPDDCCFRHLLPVSPPLPTQTHCTPPSSPPILTPHHQRLCKTSSCHAHHGPIGHEHKLHPSTSFSASLRTASSMPLGPFIVGLVLLSVLPLLFLVARHLAKRSRQLPWSIDDTLLVLALVSPALSSLTTTVVLTLCR